MEVAVVAEVGRRTAGARFPGSGNVGRRPRKKVEFLGSGSNELRLRGSELIYVWVLKVKWRGNMELLRPI